MKTKFDELLEFPTVLNFKVMGLAVENLSDLIIAELQKHTPGDYSPKIKPSSKGNYHSVSIANSRYVKRPCRAYLQKLICYRRSALRFIIQVLSSYFDPTSDYSTTR